MSTRRTPLGGSVLRAHIRWEDEAQTCATLRAFAHRLHQMATAPGASWMSTEAGLENGVLSYDCLRNGLQVGLCPHAFEDGNFSVTKPAYRHYWQTERTGPECEDGTEASRPPGNCRALVLRLSAQLGDACTCVRM